MSIRGIYIEGSSARRCAELLDSRGGMSIDRMHDELDITLVAARHAVTRLIIDGYLKRTKKVERVGTGHPKPIYARTTKPIPPALKEGQSVSSIMQNAVPHRHAHDVWLFGEYVRAA
jgi:predicted ArsR family transcriptional regulator